jgi:hypothetical protein
VSREPRLIHRKGDDPPRAAPSIDYFNFFNASKILSVGGCLVMS